MLAQYPELHARLNIDAAAKQAANFLNVSLEKLNAFARATGDSSLYNLSLDNLAAVDNDIAKCSIWHTGQSAGYTNTMITNSKNIIKVSHINLTFMWETFVFYHFLYKISSLSSGFNILEAYPCKL